MTESYTDDTQESELSLDTIGCNHVCGCYESIDDPQSVIYSQSLQSVTG